MLLCFRHRVSKTSHAKSNQPGEALPDVLIYGERIGKLAKLAPSCAAAIFDPTRQTVLVTRRSDNGRLCMPSGAMDPGESTPECCAREILEETGLVVRVGRLVGVYSSPHHIVEYRDGNRRQGLTLVFEAEPIGGELCVTDETTEVGYFSPEQMNAMDVMEPTYEWVADALTCQEAAYVR